VQAQRPHTELSRREFRRRSFARAVGGEEQAGADKFPNVAQHLKDGLPGRIVRPPVFFERPARYIVIVSVADAAVQRNYVIREFVNTVDSAAVRVDDDIAPIQFVSVYHKLQRAHGPHRAHLPAAASFSQRWFATPHEVLQADWHEVWHCPQPPPAALRAKSLVLSVKICFIAIVLHKKMIAKS
jgi:hypothetical protein